MAERLSDIDAQIQNVRQLESVVTAIRGIAASRAQQGRAMLPGIEQYAQVVSTAISQALGLMPEDGAAPAKSGHGRRGLILFCAEQGFAGAFSERILDSVKDELADAAVLLVGMRGAVAAEERGVHPVWHAPMATSAAGIPGLANRIAEALYEHVADGSVADVDVAYAHGRTGSGVEVERHSLLPIDLSRFPREVRNHPPLTTLPPAKLVEQLAGEYVYAQLCQAAMHAFAAENEARMVAMANARTNIQAKLAGLTQREHQLRQEEITTEIIELAAGAEAAAAGHQRRKPSGVIRGTERRAGETSPAS